MYAKSKTTYDSDGPVRSFPLNVYVVHLTIINSVPLVYRKNNIFNLSSRPIRILAKPIIIDMCNMCVCACFHYSYIKRIYGLCNTPADYILTVYAVYV